MIVYRYTLAVAGDAGTLTLDAVSGEGDCLPIPSEWLQDQFYGLGIETLYKQTENCLPERICLTPAGGEL